MVILNQPELNLAFEQYNLRSRCYKHVLYYCNAQAKAFRLFFVKTSPVFSWAVLDFGTKMVGTIGISGRCDSVGAMPLQPAT
jgi:hypothetical protein